MKRKNTVILLISSLLLLSLFLNMSLIKQTNFSPKTVSSSVSQELVKDISWRPFTSSISINTPMFFVIIPNVYNIEDLEFQLWEKYNDKQWEIALPYTKLSANRRLDDWITDKYTFKDTGICDLQIDVRVKNMPTIEQKNLARTVLRP